MRGGYRPKAGRPKGSKSETPYRLATSGPSADKRGIVQVWREYLEEVDPTDEQGRTRKQRMADKLYSLLIDHDNVQAAIVLSTHTEGQPRQRVETVSMEVPPFIVMGGTEFDRNPPALPEPKEEE